MSDSSSHIHFGEILPPGAFSVCDDEPISVNHFVELVSDRHPTGGGRRELIFVQLFPELATMVSSAGTCVGLVGAGEGWKSQRVHRPQEDSTHLQLSPNRAGDSDAE